MGPTDLSAAEANPGAAELRLARVLAARMTHDLGSPLGTLAGMLDMLEDDPKAADAELLAVARQAAQDLRARLALQRAAWGGGEEPTDQAGLLALLAGSAAAQRVRFDLAGPWFAAPLPAERVPLLLNAALLAAEALPRGGVVTASGGGGDLMLLPEGRNAAWPAETLATLAGRQANPLAAGPRHLVAPLLLALAAEQGFEVALLPGMGPGLPALLLTRRG